MGGVSVDEDRSQRRIGGRYLLTGQLGSGAMGTVWSAFDEVLRRPVAVKELKVPLGVPEREAEAMRERMLREARALGGLSHPNVITVYDVVDAEGLPLVVLEMLPSRNLATVITEGGALSPEQAAVVGYATAAALRAAHRRDITHRDVKPANVLVGDDGRVKLTDFGIARNAADVTMTTAGLVLGSPAYIAPEVASGQPVKPAADLWGLGATLFAAIEGRPPYDVRGEAVATITEVVDGEVPRTRDTGPVGEVVAALMMKDPARRISLDEVRRRLRPLIPDPDDPVYPDSPITSAIPTMTGTDGTGGLAATPMPRAAVAMRPPPAAETGAQLPAGPLASAPGPLPWEVGAPPPPAPVPVARPTPPAAPAATPTRLSTRAGVGLVLAGTAIVLGGAVVGWTATRGVAGQSPMSTMTVTADGVDTVTHTDPLGFRVDAPEEWEVTRDGPTLVSFVSPDGAEKLVVERATSAEAVTGGLPGVLGDGVVTPLVTTVPAPEGAVQYVHHGLRTSWLRVLPAADGVWVVRLTAPGGTTEPISQQLFERLAGSFTPVG